MIYIITNTITGDQYIGKTEKTVEKRWEKHCYNAQAGQDTYLYRAMRKYGIEAFTIKFLCDGLDEEEVTMIASLKPKYNMTRGGTGGDTSASLRYQAALLRRNYKGENNPNYGKRGSNSPNYGKKRTDEQKAKMANSDYLKSKRKPVIIDGIQYDSVMGAARAHNRSERWVRLHDELNEWNY